VPTPLAALLGRLLAKSPADRPATAGAVRDALEGGAVHASTELPRPVVVRPPSEGPRPASRVADPLAETHDARLAKPAAAVGSMAVDPTASTGSAERPKAPRSKWIMRGVVVGIVVLVLVFVKVNRDRQDGRQPPRQPVTRPSPLPDPRQQPAPRPVPRASPRSRRRRRLG